MDPQRKSILRLDCSWLIIFFALAGCFCQTSARHWEELKSCPFPRVIPYGQVTPPKNGAPYVIGDEIKIQCDRDYRPVRRGDYLRCAHVDWNGGFPVCEEVFCETPSMVDNGQNLAEPVDYVVTLKCNEDYILSTRSDISRTCINKGHWSYVQTFCEKIRCERPPDFPQAEMKTYIYKAPRYSTRNNGQIKDMEVGFEVHYKCLAGYNLVIDDNQVPKISCLETGQWSTPEFTCESVSCGQLPHIMNGYLTLERYKNLTGSKALVSCDESFVALKTEFYCRPDGQWDVDDFVCQKLKLEPQCGPVPVIKNGWLKTPAAGKTFSVGTSAQVICNEAYVSNSFSATCEESGFWNIKNVACYKQEIEILCQTPPEFYGAEIEVNNNGFETHASFFNAGDPNRKVTNLNPGIKVTYKCQKGYNLFLDENAEPEITCLETGQWSKPKFTCEKPKCGAVPMIDNGVLRAPPNKRTFSVGSFVRVRCDEGYISKSVSVPCQEDGVWNLRNVGCHKEAKCHPDEDDEWTPEVKVDEWTPEVKDDEWTVEVKQEERTTEVKGDEWTVAVKGETGTQEVKVEKGTQEVKVEIGIPKVNKTVPAERTAQDYSVCGKDFNQSTVDEVLAPFDETDVKESSTYKRWPWTTQIYYVKGKGKVIAKCLGSLISADMVLTSSLCFENNTDPKKILTKTGVEKYHASFAEKFINVGLTASKAVIIKLRRSVTFSQNTRPVCLPSNKFKNEIARTGPSSMGYMSSWSKDKKGNIARVHVKIASAKECRDGIRNIGGQNGEVGTNIFCAGNAGAALDVCGPDLGSPLFQYHYDSKNEVRWVQTGLAVAFTREIQDHDSAAAVGECYKPSPSYNVFLNLKPLLESIYEIIERPKLKQVSASIEAYNQKSLI